MKKEHKNLTPVELALLTWYKPDNPNYRDKTHPTIKLAGEIGELLDLYGKHLYKPGFDWMTICKHCRQNKHYGDNSCISQTKKYKTYKTPYVIDELGDIWYYLRILAWQYDTSFEDYYAHSKDELSIIISMYDYANSILQDTDIDTTLESIQEIYEHLLFLLEKLGYTIEGLTLLNYKKLNSEVSNHGWANAE